MHLLLVPEGQYTKDVVPSKLAVPYISFLLPTLSVDPSSLFASTVPLFQMMSGNKTTEQDCEPCMM